LEARQKEHILIKKILNGDKQAFRMLYTNYVKAFMLICLRYIKQRHDAEDILQDSFVKIYRALHKYDESKGSFYSWSKRIIINECLQSLRKKKHEFSFDVFPDSEKIIKLNQETEEQLSLQELTELIQALPKGYRTIFNLYVIDGFKHQEIAEMMNIAESTSKTQLLKAKKMLQGQIKKKEKILISRYA